jgi:hypothetical protein
MSSRIDWKKPISIALSDGQSGAGAQEMTFNVAVAAEALPKIMDLRARA